MSPVDHWFGAVTRYVSHWESDADTNVALQAGEFFIENVLKGKGAQRKTTSLISEEALSQKPTVSQ